MNNATPKPTSWTRAGLMVILFCLIYLAVVTANYFCLKNQVYNNATGWTVFIGLGVITFALAVLALFRPRN